MWKFHRRFATILGMGVSLSACGSDEEPKESAAPASFVLVHGAWMGAWAWDDVAAELAASGAAVTQVDLPAHGQSTAGVADASLDAYVGVVSTAVEKAEPPVVLVGHSMAGIVITEAAERKPDSIDRLVYLAAYLPKDGETLQALAASDPDSQVGHVLQIDATQGVASIPLDALGDVFCGDCSEADIAKLESAYRDEPIAPFATPVHRTETGWGRVPKHYFFTSHDRAVSPALQLTMTEGIDFAGTVTLETSHSPFLSNPAAVAASLSALSSEEQSQ